MNVRQIFLLFIFLTSCQTSGVSEKSELKSKYHVDLALGFLRHKKNPEAIAELQMAIKLNPQNSSAYHYLGMCLYQRGRLQESIDAFLTSLSVDPTGTAVRNDLVTIYLENRNFEEAYKHASISANDLTYTNPTQSLFLKSKAAVQLGRQNPRYYKIAENTLRATLNLNPKHCGALYDLGSIYTKKQQLKKSYVLYHKSLKNCQLDEDKLKSINALIPLSKKFGLVYQWGRYKQLKTELAKKSKNIN
jgi:Tfp pilus assembly protein PilF